VVFLPKRRKKRVLGALRKQLVEVFHELASHKESKIVEGHLMHDHIHMCISIPPKYAVCNVVGYLKGKSAITIARRFAGHRRNFTGETFWARGYFVSTVGLDEAMVRAYIRNQEQKMSDTIRRSWEYSPPLSGGSCFHRPFEGLTHRAPALPGGYLLPLLHLRSSKRPVYGGSRFALGYATIFIMRSRQRG
jgi:putative transposase